MEMKEKSIRDALLSLIKTSVTGSVCDIVALRTPTSMTELNIFRERATNHCAKLGIIF